MHKSEERVFLAREKDDYLGNGHEPVRISGAGFELGDIRGGGIAARSAELKGYLRLGSSGFGLRPYQ